jgi:hypothetical protein
MLYFPILRTRHLAIQLRELSIADSLRIARIPAHLGEASTSAFLAAAVLSVTPPSLADPALWTVEERMMAVCHYLAVTSDGEPDFAVGEGKYSDYLAVSPDDNQEQIDLIELEGDHWKMRALIGREAERIERLEGEIPELSGRAHWMVGGMAAQLIRDGEAMNEEHTDDAALLERMCVFSGFPESSFLKLFASYREDRTRLQHLFATDFSATGIVALPKKGGRDDLPPARFPGVACVSRLAQTPAGRP